MKRLLLILLAAVLLFGALPISAVAENLSFFGGELSVNDDDIGQINAFSYDAQKKKINVSGTVAHDTITSRSKDKLEVYRVPMGADPSGIISAPDAEPVIRTEISVKFNFSISVEHVEDRFSAYVVVIRGDDGSWVTIGSPLYATVETTPVNVVADRVNYKGVSTSLTSLATDINAGTTIIPVRFSELLSHSSTGHLYSFEGAHFYFDTQYLKELDAKLNSYNAIGARVYLQFIFDLVSDDSISVFATAADTGTIPDMRNPQNLTPIAALTEFLTLRYDFLSGIVLGSRIDVFYSDSMGISESEYAINYAQYMMAVANTARLHIPTLDVVIPVSDADSYTQSVSEGFTGAKLFESIGAFFDEYYLEKFNYCALIESSSVPYGITEETLVNKRFQVGAYKGINADTVHRFSKYLNTIKTKYKSLPSSYIFEWKPQADINPEVLATAYAYSYFKLMADAQISSFVVSFEESEILGDFDAFPEILEIMKYIDTSECFNITAPQAELLGGEWSAIISGMYQGKLDIRHVFSVDPLGYLPEDILGSFTYFDFMYYTDLSIWKTGNFCDSIRFDTSKLLGRSLKAHFTEAKRSPSEYAEFFCDYNYPENFAFTPYVSFELCVEEDTPRADIEALYEVKITLGSDTDMVETSVICVAGEIKEVFLDISAFSDVAMAEHIKISARALSEFEAGKGYSIYLSTLKGYSSEYTENELSALITEERLRIRNEIDSDGYSDSGRKNFARITGAIVIIAVVGIGVFMFLRKDDEHNEEE